VVGVVHTAVKQGKVSPVDPAGAEAEKGLNLTAEIKVVILHLKEIMVVNTTTVAVAEL
tara:strand:+ start:339 stop:512 length:174 start_codon:yes stop_codon:yes gene_type:complete